MSAFETAPVPATGNDDLATSTRARPFAVTLDFPSGTLTPAGGMFVRRLSDMAILYEDQEAVKRALGAGDDPVVYRGHQAGVPESPGHLAFMTTTIAAGTVGSEFYMTKGHYHVQDSGEMYLGLSGHGIMVMESRRRRVRGRGPLTGSGGLRSAGLGPPHREHRSRAARFSGQLLCRRRARLRLCRAVRVFSAGIPRRERP